MIPGLVANRVSALPMDQVRLSLGVKPPFKEACTLEWRQLQGGLLAEADSSAQGSLRPPDSRVNL